MADQWTPVATGIVPPNPQAGLNTLSSLLGIQQQRQTLQTGQYTQASAQAESQVAGQNAKEKMALAQLLQDPVGNGIVDSDGNPTKQAQSIVMRAAPTTGAGHYADIVSAAGKKIEFNNAVNNLRTNERTEVQNTLGGVAADPNATASDAATALGNLVESKRGTPVYDDYKTIGAAASTVLNHADQEQKKLGKQIPPGTEAWRPLALNLVRGGLGAAGIAGAGGVGVEGVATTGAGTVNRNPITGALTQPPGASTGSAINPTPVQVAGATMTATGTAAGDNVRNAQISDSVAPSRQAILLTQQMDKYADMVRTGKYSQEIANAQAALGVNSPEAAARQLMGKTAAQLRTIAIANAPSDTARDTINAGFPDPDKMNPDAIHGADEMIRGNMKMNLARSANAQRFQNTHNGTQGLRQADDQLTGTADGLMYEYQGLKPGPERQAFLQRHFQSRDEANAWISRKNLVEHNGGFQQ